MLPRPAQVLLPPWLEQVELLGRGAMGVVLRAWDVRLQRPVAVKRQTLGLDRACLGERFLREARLLARVRHPGIVVVHDVVELGDEVLLIQELVEGGSLDERLQGGVPVAPSMVAAWGAQLAEALAAIHRGGILHRDVKPANLLFRASGDLVLCDFGLALDEREADRLTRTGVVVGTPSYMAPELWLGEGHSPASEQWSLGAVLLRALLGAPEGSGALPRAQTLMALGGEELPPPDPARDPAPVLTRILLRALRRDPRHRYRDLAAFGDALRSWSRRPRSGSPGRRSTGARGPGAASLRLPLSALSRRRPWPLGWSSLALAACLALWGVAGGVGVGSWTRPVLPPRAAEDPPPTSRLGARLSAALGGGAGAPGWKGAAERLVRSGVVDLWEAHLASLERALMEGAAPRGETGELHRTPPWDLGLLVAVARDLRRLDRGADLRWALRTLGLDGDRGAEQLWRRWLRVRDRFRDPAAGLVRRLVDAGPDFSGALVGAALAGALEDPAARLFVARARELLRAGLGEVPPELLLELDADLRRVAHDLETGESDDSSNA